MNRGPFLHGMLRFANAKYEKNRRYKKVSRARAILNLICFLLGLSTVIVVFALGGGPGFIAGAFFFLAIGSIPFTMSLGRKFVMNELEIAVNQRRCEEKLDFSTKKAMIGYTLMFAPLYIIMLACFFFPAKDAWIVPYIPTFVYTIISIILSVHTVENLDFSIKKYKRVHILLFISIAVIGALIRIFIMHPFLTK